MAKSKPNIKNILSVIGTVLTVLVVILTLFVAVNVVISRVRKRPVGFFGYSFATVLTPSMEPDIMTGDLIVFKSCDIADIGVGDDIVFIAGSGFDGIEGQCVVHRVISAENGVFETKGVNNASPDKDKVTEDNFLGICIANSAGWGVFFRFITGYGILIIIALIAVPVIVSQVIKIFKLAKQEKSNAEEADDDGVNDKENK